jgi:hypothetical protein
MEEQDPLIASYRLDKTVIEVVSGFNEVPDDRPFWLSKTPAERLRALELLRRLNYGHERATARLQRVFEVVKIK